MAKHTLPINMRDYNLELKKRVEFIQNVLKESHADGIVFGNSGGKDSALVGILCKTACDNTVGISMPCSSKQNYAEDMDDAKALSSQYGISLRNVDLSSLKDEAIKTYSTFNLSKSASINIAPRLRMLTLYTIAAAENRIVAGTGNRSEIHMGYFTKWGDGAYDFNPIADLTATEVFEFLTFLNAPNNIIKKAPSGGLFEGQTDEKEMGISYADIDNFLINGEVSEENKAIIDHFHNKSHHKRTLPKKYGE